jgi:MFS family permease
VKTQLIVSRRLGPLLATQFLGAFNDNTLRFAIIMLFATGGTIDDSASRSLIALTGAIFIAPFLIFSAIAGQIADKFEKARLIRQIKSTEIGVVVISGYGFFASNYYLLLLALFLMGTQSTFFGPLKYAILPQHVKKEELTSANAALQATTYMAILLGTISGGLLVGQGENEALLIVAVCASIAILGRLTAQFIPDASASEPTLQFEMNAMRATTATLREITSDNRLLLVTMMISAFWFCGSSYLAALPTYAKTLLNSDNQFITLLNVMFTTGIGTGAFTCALVSKNKIKLSLVTIGGGGAILAAFDVFLIGTPALALNTTTVANFMHSPVANRLLFDLFAIGFFGALYIIPLYACLQRDLNPLRSARTLAGLNICNAVFMVLSALVAIVIYSFGFNEPQLFGIVSCASLIGLGWAWKLWPDLHLNSKDRC